MSTHLLSAGDMAKKSITNLDCDTLAAVSTTWSHGVVMIKQDNIVLHEWEMKTRSSATENMETRSSVTASYRWVEGKQVSDVYLNCRHDLQCLLLVLRLTSFLI